MYKKRREKTPEQALNSLMRLASRSEKSTGDARRLMRTWGVAPEHIEGVVERLVETKFIDDERFAAAYVREKSRFSGWGIYKIRAGLAQKGISPPMIAEALDGLEQRDTEAMDEKLHRDLERKRRSVKSDDRFEIRSKLIR